MTGHLQRIGPRALVALVVLWAGLAVARAQPCDPRNDPEGHVPLPVTWELQTLAADVPPNLARWQGVWAGVWADELKYVLVVEQIAADGAAQVVYAVSDSVAWSVFRNWSRQPARFENRRLVFERYGASIVHEFDADNRLLGTFRVKSGRTNRSVMERAGLPALTSYGPGDGNCFAWPLAGERVRIPHLTVKTPDGARPITLEARLYRPKSTAPAPLAIINHGSDMGRDLLKSHSYLDEALWLLDKGYAVLVPMRRGRGQSDGVYGEDTYVHDRMGAVADVSLGVHQAVEDLDSAIAYGRTLDFVKAGPVLLAGQSRGGFLSVVYAGMKPEAVLGVVNFVGGWLAGAGVDRVLAFFEQAGRGTGARVLQLWLYTDKDSFYNEERIRAQLAAFTGAGGVARFEFFRDVPGNGHYLKSFPDRWRPAADAFLADLPVAPR
jgi:dienelactone hydrolase